MSGMKKKVGKKASGAMKSAKSSFIAGNKSSLALSSHDINVISVAAQLPKLPRDELMRLLTESGASKNAMDIVTIILGGGPAAPQKTSSFEVKKAIASNYVSWASDLGVQNRSSAAAKTAVAAKKHGKSWTSEDVRTLRALAKQNTPTRVIGIKTGRTEASIRGKAAAEGISLSPVNQSPYGSKKRGPAGSEDAKGRGKLAAVASKGRR